MIFIRKSILIQRLNTISNQNQYRFQYSFIYCLFFSQINNLNFTFFYKALVDSLPVLLTQHLKYMTPTFSSKFDQNFNTKALIVHNNNIEKLFKNWKKNYQETFYFDYLI